MTASILEEEKAVVLGAGYDDFVRKPFREDAIWEKIAKYLGVRYVYADHQPSSDASLNYQFNGQLKEKVESYVLKAESLNVMPADWVTQLNYAAIQLDTEQVGALIAQIPEKHTSLAKALQQKVNDFDFGQIINLTQYIPCL